VVDPFASSAPTILRGEGLDWPILRVLRPGELVRVYGHLRFEVEMPVPAGDRTMSIRELFEHVERHPDEVAYMRNSLLSAFGAELAQLLPAPVRDLNWLGRLPEDARPEWTWVMVGGPGSTSPLHTDVAGSSAWNLLVTGRKRWHVVPPATSLELGLLPAGMGTDPPWPGDATGPVRFTQEPGDVVVVPSGWAHEVENEVVSVALTGNFVDASNVDFVRRYAREVGDAGALAVLDMLVVDNAPGPAS
jgi:hypothetical protein